jgi:hypothetical protein
VPYAGTPIAKDPVGLKTELEAAGVRVYLRWLSGSEPAAAPAAPWVCWRTMESAGAKVEIYVLPDVAGDRVGRL